MQMTDNMTAWKNKRSNRYLEASPDKASLTVKECKEQNEDDVQRKA